MVADFLEKVDPTLKNPEAKISQGSMSEDQEEMDWWMASAA